jgi:membrane protein implicated in regulation of membrane protease activity
MTIRIAILAIATAAAMVATPVAGAATTTTVETTRVNAAMTEADVRALMADQGYKEIHDVEFKGGTWTADAESADGNHVEVRIDSVTGKIIPDEPVATIGKDAIVTMLLNAGYTHVHDVEMDDGVWNAEADDPKGNDVELKLDPNDGHILGSETD